MVCAIYSIIFCKFGTPPLSVLWALGEFFELHEKGNLAGCCCQYYCFVEVGG